MAEATSNAPLTVVLVHGAFADSSSWTGVIERPEADCAVVDRCAARVFTGADSPRERR